jgi:intracellular sulfur oxidation DsrE/DsrF family protein
MGLATISAPLQQLHASPGNLSNPDDPDEIFKKLNGRHRIVFDATRPHEIMPVIWPKVFLLTNEMTGTPVKDQNVVVILRHDAIPYAFEDRLWQKYNFASMFKVDDPRTKKPAEVNPFWKPKPDDYKVPGFGAVPIGINDLQESGVIFCVCNAAMTVYSAAAASAMSLQANDVLNEWKAGVLPGIHIVPSGVWAVGRAQEAKCAYCFAG